MPSTSTKQLDKGKEKVMDEEEEDEHETEQEFELIHVDRNDENEARISSMLLKGKYAQIKDLQANLARAGNAIHYYEVENKQLEAQKAIYEVREIRAWKEVERTKVRLDEVLGVFDESEDEEGQLSRRRPRTMGLRKALAKEKEQETTLEEQLTLSEMLAMEIEYNREPWLERANTHLEDQLEKTQKDLGLQKKMAKHYALRNKIARAKLKRALAKI